VLAQGEGREGEWIVTSFKNIRYYIEYGTVPYKT
jgi:hypothetical protein